MMLADRSFFARTLREANSWIEPGLHPNNTCCVVCRIEGVPHIFVEFVDGGNLRQWIEDGKCIDTRINLDLALRFCHGMEHPHSKGLIHCDVEPVMTRDGLLKVTAANDRCGSTPSSGTTATTSFLQPGPSVSLSVVGRLAMILVGTPTPTG